MLDTLDLTPTPEHPRDPHPATGPGMIDITLSMSEKGDVIPCVPVLVLSPDPPGLLGRGMHAGGENLLRSLEVVRGRHHDRDTLSLPERR